jgi:hypothetical protein
MPGGDHFHGQIESGPERRERQAREAFEAYKKDVGEAVNKSDPVKADRKAADHGGGWLGMFKPTSPYVDKLTITFPAPAPALSDAAPAAGAGSGQGDVVVTGFIDHKHSLAKGAYGQVLRLVTPEGNVFAVKKYMLTQKRYEEEKAKVKAKEVAKAKAKEEAMATASGEHAAGAAPAGAGCAAVVSIEETVSNNQVALFNEMLTRNEEVWRESLSDSTARRFLDGDRICSVMPHYNGGNLQQAFHNESSFWRSLSLPLRWSIFKKYLTLMKTQFHDKGIFHIDVKPLNLMLHVDYKTGDIELRPVDFDCAEKTVCDHDFDICYTTWEMQKPVHDYLTGEAATDVRASRLRRIDCALLATNLAYAFPDVFNITEPGLVAASSAAGSGAAGAAGETKESRGRHFSAALKPGHEDRAEVAEIHKMFNRLSGYPVPSVGRDTGAGVAAPAARAAMPLVVLRAVPAIPDFAAEAVEAGAAAADPIKSKLKAACVRFEYLALKRDITQLTSYLDLHYNRSWGSAKKPHWARLKTYLNSVETEVSKVTVMDAGKLSRFEAILKEVIREIAIVSKHTTGNAATSWCDFPRMGLALESHACRQALFKSYTTLNSTSPSLTLSGCVSGVSGKVKNFIAYDKAIERAPDYGTLDDMTKVGEHIKSGNKLPDVQKIKALLAPSSARRTVSVAGGPTFGAARFVRK